MPYLVCYHCQSSLLGQTGQQPPPHCPFCGQSLRRANRREFREWRQRRAEQQQEEVVVSGE
jgi:hypothetical protein